MDENVRKIVTSIGAIAEVCGCLRDGLMKNGFTREEAFHLVNTYLKQTFTFTKEEDKNNG